MDTTPTSPSGGDSAPEIADAASLFGDDPKSAPRPSAPLTSDHDEVFEVEERDEPRRRPAPPLPIEETTRSPRTSSNTKPKPTAMVSPASKPKLEPSRAVEEVWSRGAEWGATLALLALASLGLVSFLYLMVYTELYTLAFLTMMAGGCGLVLLSYPILITLERPVRVTPEHAVADYYAALSHHFPHYRRMWLLLSRDGRVSPSFGSFEGFRAYWSRRVAALKSGRASSLTPLKFQVSDFSSPKSAGLTEIEVKFTVSVSVRGQTQAGPIEEHRVTTTLVKGPDRMWYLDQGTLP